MRTGVEEQEQGDRDVPSAPAPRAYGLRHFLGSEFPVFPVCSQLLLASSLALPVDAPPAKVAVPGSAALRRGRRARLCFYCSLSRREVLSSVGNLVLVQGPGWSCRTWLFQEGEEQRGCSCRACPLPRPWLPLR
jgi:hypothetical protein